MNRREMFGVLGGLGAGLALGAPTAAAGHEGKEDGHGSTPLGGPHAHFCGIHVAKKDPGFQIITQHYCAAHSTEQGEQLFQCVLFDSREKTAKLIGIEYIIGDGQYRRLPDEEKKYWHPHTYEVLGGGLIAPGMDPDEEMRFMKFVLNTWGKTWHTWPDPKTPVPLGEPLLIWSITGDGQVDEKVLAARDQQFGVSAQKIRDARGAAIGYEVPNVPPPKSVDEVGRQWTARGEDKPTLRK